MLRQLPTGMDVSQDDWTFTGASTRELTHCYHDYPARMIPQIARRLLDMFAPSGAALLFDPYCGTGTSLVEGLVRGLDVTGTDLNPLARLIAQAKTSTPDLQQVDKRIAQFGRRGLDSEHTSRSKRPEIPGICRVEFWFKPAVVRELLEVREFVDEIEDRAVRLFFQVAFSETVRECSNTRNGEFKLYRYEAERLERFNPDVLETMASKLKRNRAGLKAFLDVMHELRRAPVAGVCDFNTVEGVPTDLVAPSSVDIVITSPPYGDSNTTVAYGQYSRLSAAWLGLEKPDRIDARLMGGRIYKSTADLPSDPLNDALAAIRNLDEKRCRQVAAFYRDLRKSIAHVAQVIKPGGYACYVVGNRKVKGTVLPTDMTIRDFFQENGFEHVDTLHRSIPNKRMPSRNSPTNKSGIVGSTMLEEHIVVMQRTTSNPRYTPGFRLSDHAAPTSI